MGKKLLILGSDFSTVHLVEEAKKMGVYVIVTDLMTTSPTKEIADEAWNISTTDIEILIKKIKEENIDGILAGASEFNIENCREICKRLDLPLYCSSDNAWEVSRNKRKFKDLCLKHGVRVAEDYHLNDELSEDSLKNIKYPVVVKPVDKSGNRGMSYCNNKEELIEGYKKARAISDNENIIVEKQLKGGEYTGYYVIADGEIVLSYYTSMHHEPRMAENLYSIEYISSCHLKQYLEEVNEPLIKVFKDAGCKNGIAWTELMYDNDGHFYALEMGHRFAGPGIYAVHEKISGFNTYKWMIEFALGKEHKKSDLPKPLDSAYIKCAGAYDLFTTHEAVVDKMEGLDEVLKLNNVVIDMPKRQGDSVRANVNMGIVKIYGKDCEEMCDTIKKVNELLTITDESGDNIYIHYTDFETLRKEYKEGLIQFEVVDKE
ncbi:ATP-grasp domain-containing protein [Parvimonas micra]|jgi:Biotin carboxylase|uniref:ATP-grasp domain-containing protein n=1 Tax=Parvimonas micra TaxID=33033 RepID=UPI0030CF2AF5